jgi:hypothetical protein
LPRPSSTASASERQGVRTKNCGTRPYERAPHVGSRLTPLEP